LSDFWRALIFVALLFGCQEPEPELDAVQPEIDWSLWGETSRVEFFLPGNVGMVSIADHTFTWDDESHQWIRQDEAECVLHTGEGGDE